MHGILWAVFVCKSFKIVLLEFYAKLSWLNKIEPSKSEGQKKRQNIAPSIDLAKLTKRIKAIVRVHWRAKQSGRQIVGSVTIIPRGIP